MGKKNFKQSSLIYNGYSIKLDPNIETNWIKHDHITYIISELNIKKGSHSFTFSVKNDENEMIIKFCKYYKPNDKKLIRRFSNEITALKKAKEKHIHYIIEIIDDGELEIDGYKFKFYFMEKAQSDLTTNLYHEEYDMQGKVQLCIEIMKGISKLNEIGIYHRDIKPDNILFVDGKWKIGDLGLCEAKSLFENIDKYGEKIGPIGFLSPEAVNKLFTEKYTQGKFDCIIDEKSDIFQLGKVLWFIFQGNVPFGQLKEDDSRFSDSDIYEVIEKMLQYEKQRRADFTYIFDKFNVISKKYYIT